jgi:hypothetical protein
MQILKIFEIISKYCRSLTISLVVIPRQAKALRAQSPNESLDLRLAYDKKLSINFLHF